MKLPLKDAKVFARGRRGLLYKGMYKGKPAVVKTTHPSSEAEGRIENECEYLKQLNQHDIGPRLIDCAEDEMMYYFVEGEFIQDYVQHVDKKEIIRNLVDVFNQCFVLDQLFINKEEMNHPYKHVVCKKGKDPVMLDFERCKQTKKPKNVTQFCQYVTSGKFLHLVNGKFKPDKKNMQDLAKAYKVDLGKRSFTAIVSYVKKC